MRAFILLVALTVKASWASSCLEDTDVTATEEDTAMELDVAVSKISRIVKDACAHMVKDACACPMYNRPMDCEEVLKNGHRTSGVYTIWPKKPLFGCESLQVYCDMDTDGGGWTVIQRRGDFTTPDDFFNQDWDTYKKGFGKPTEEFWLGNEYIYVITNQGQYSARIDLRNHKGEEKYAVYKIFSVEHEKTNYKLRIGEYTGTAGDSISGHNGRDFYTKDRPNRPQEFGNFRGVPNSGWWFNVFPSTNINGLKRTSGNDGIVWSTFGGYSPGLVFTEIKLRPKRY